METKTSYQPTKYGTITKIGVALAGVVLVGYTALHIASTYVDKRNEGAKCPAAATFKQVFNDVGDTGYSAIESTIEKTKKVSEEIEKYSPKDNSFVKPTPQKEEAKKEVECRKLFDDYTSSKSEEQLEEKIN